MGFISLLYPWGLILQAVAIVHFIRRRPEGFWLFVIVFLGPVGALVYIAMEVVPDLGLLQQSFDAFGRRKRIARLEAIVRDNPSPGTYEELAELYLDEGRFARARECYDKAITPRADSRDAIYRRGIAEIHLGDFAAATRDLEHVTARDSRYDLHRATGLLAHAYANTGQPVAAFLAAQNRTDEAREWAGRILAKKPTMPRYLQRRERPWFRRAKTLLKRLQA